MTMKLKNQIDNRIYVESFEPVEYGKIVYDSAVSSTQQLRFLTEYYGKFQNYSRIEFWITGESTTDSPAGVHPRAVVMSGTSLVYPSMFQCGLETWNNSVTQINRKLENVGDFCSARQIANCSYSYHVILYNGQSSNYPTFFAESYGGNYDNSTACTEVFTGRMLSSISTLYAIEMSPVARKAGFTFRYKLFK